MPKKDDDFFIIYQICKRVNKTLDDVYDSISSDLFNAQIKDIGALLNSIQVSQESKNYILSRISEKHGCEPLILRYFETYYPKTECVRIVLPKDDESTRKKSIKQRVDELSYDIDGLLNEVKSFIKFVYSTIKVNNSKEKYIYSLIDSLDDIFISSLAPNIKSIDTEIE